MYLTFWVHFLENISSYTFDTNTFWIEIHFGLKCTHGLKYICGLKYISGLKYIFGLKYLFWFYYIFCWNTFWAHFTFWLKYIYGTKDVFLCVLVTFFIKYSYSMIYISTRSKFQFRHKIHFWEKKIVAIKKSYKRLHEEKTCLLVGLPALKKAFVWYIFQRLDQIQSKNV